MRPLKNMKPVKAIRVINSRYPYIGPLFWAVSLQYYIIQTVVAAAWQVIPYSWSRNTISDLGNTVCGLYADRYVCSPENLIMNLSFIALGLLMIAGASLIYHKFKQSNGSRLGFSAMAIAGVGTVLVGLFPENVVGHLHVIGAGLAFLIGNVGVLILGNALNMPKSLRVYTYISGIVGLGGLVLFYSGTYLGLGIGGMERIAAYPQTMWLVVFGLYITIDQYQRA